MFILSFMSLALGDVSVRMLLHGMSEIFGGGFFYFCSPLYHQNLHKIGTQKIFFDEMKNSVRLQGDYHLHWVDYKIKAKKKNDLLKSNCCPGWVLSWLEHCPDTLRLLV